MNIHHQRAVEIEVGPEELPERLELWAEETGFGLVNAAAGRWVYQRGSWWSVLYSFAIRKWPTTVVVQAEGSDPVRVRCSIQCKFWWTAPLPDDSLILQDDLEALVGRICERHSLPIRYPIEEER